MPWTQPCASTAGLYSKYNDKGYKYRVATLFCVLHTLRRLIEEVQSYVLIEFPKCAIVK